MSNAERLSDDTQLDTPALVAQAFREVVRELKEEGKLNQPAAITFMEAAAGLNEALAASHEAAINPDSVRGVMNRITMVATVIGGMGNSVLTTKAERLN
jgi:hypothetical protein